jgi:hypothetical protein
MLLILRSSAVRAVLVAAATFAARDALLAIGGQAAPAAPSPLVGDWVANIAKSKRHPNHQFKSATLRFSVDGEQVTIVHGGVNAGGEEESGTVVIQADGKEHAVPGQADVTLVTRWAGPRRLESAARRGLTVIGEQTYEVAADGKLLTATVWGTDASGSRFEQVIVFDRK